MPIVTFIVFAIQAKVRGTPALSINQTFTSLSILSLASKPGSQLLAAYPIAASASGSLNRLQKFMLAPSSIDCRYGPIHETGSPTRPKASQTGIELEAFERPKPSLGHYALLVEDATIQPSPESSPVLKDINARMESSTLTIVVGPVGCGECSHELTASDSSEYQSPQYQHHSLYNAQSSLSCQCHMIFIF